MNARALLASLLLALPALAREPKIVIDAGHGGSQQGALSPTGYLEKELSLVLAKKVGAALQKSLNAKVVLTREDDVLLPLQDRVDISNKHRADLFLSLHANSMPTKKLREQVAGIQTFFLSANASTDGARRTADRENADGTHAVAGPGRDVLGFILADLQRAEAHVDSSRLAHAVHQSVITGTGGVDRGVQQAPFYVLAGVEAPAILLEVGFISHPDEGKKLQDAAYQDKLAQAVAQGIQAFLEEVARRDTKGAQSTSAPR
jgi:N-acetylmuramoyl-L-alanine amidase